MNVNTNSFLVSLILGHIQHYNHNRYWSLREKVINANFKTPKILKYLYLLYIKRCDAYNCASLGTDINAGAVFTQPPLLPHGIKGIIVHPRAKIGSNVTIYQHVTIAQNRGLVATIGDNVIIGAGAVIMGGGKNWEQRNNWCKFGCY